MGLPERRCSPRANYHGITFIRAAGAEFPCRASDLSEGGICVDPQGVSLHPGVDVQVTFALPTIGRWLDLKARLTRRERVRRRLVWGMRFVKVPVEVRRLLREYVTTNLDRFTPPSPRPIPTPRVRPMRPVPVTAAPVRLIIGEESEEVTRETVDVLPNRELEEKG